MSEDVYTKLREFMDKLPGGYPVTDSGVELKILRKLFSPDDAELVMSLRFEAESVPVIAGRLGMDESQAARRLAAVPLAALGTVCVLKFGSQFARFLGGAQ